MSRMRQRLSRKVTTSKPSFVSYVNDTAKPKETSEDEQSLDLDLDELSVIFNYYLLDRETSD